MTLENLHRKKKMKLAGAFIVYGVKITSEKPLSDDGDEKVGLFNYSQESKFRNLGQIAVPNDEAAVITANIFEPQVVNANIHPSWNKDLAKYREDIELKNKFISDISSADPKYAEYRDFEDSSRKKYLQVR